MQANPLLRCRCGQGGGSGARGTLDLPCPVLARPCPSYSVTRSNARRLEREAASADLDIVLLCDVIDGDQGVYPTLDIGQARPVA